MPDFPYSRYLSAKRTVDDRALNKDVIERLRAELRGRSSPLRVLEIGAGLGTMVARIGEWDLGRVEYVCLDSDPDLVAASSEWLIDWATTHRYESKQDSRGLHLRGKATELSVRFITEELTQFLARPRQERVDLLIANAFLDLVDVPSVLPDLLVFLEVDGLFWFSINFDGETIFLPELPEDEELMQVYHRSMDDRVRAGRRAGDSRTGRRLFHNLRTAGAVVLAAGSSDWVVHGRPASTDYVADEAFFLNCILNTVDAELRKHSAVNPERLARWVDLRRRQISDGELVLIVHQLDFLGHPPPRSS